MPGRSHILRFAEFGNFDRGVGSGGGFVTVHAGGDVGDLAV
jgi:hypothetical protein